MSEIIAMPEMEQKTAKPSICICMIVKNEEKRLPACLDSMQGFYTTLVIVDTGSTDRTMEIAEEYGAQLYQHEWKDFSDARNVSLNYADPDCDWIGIVDADEELEPVDFPNIYHHMMAAPEDTGGIVIQILHDRPSGWSMQPMERFFRNGSGHYRGYKHNQLVTSHKRYYINARLYHFGYNLPPKETQAKYDRDIELLEREIEEDPDNVYALRNRIMSDMSMEKYDAVIEAAEALLARDDLEISELSRQIILIDLGRSYSALGESDKAITTLEQLSSEFPVNIDAYFYLAQALFTDDQFQKASQCYEQYIKTLQRVKSGLEMVFMIVESWGLAWQAYNNMAICYAALGMFAPAMEALKISTLQAVEGRLDQMVKFFRQNMLNKGVVI